MSIPRVTCAADGPGKQNWCLLPQKDAVLADNIFIYNEFIGRAIAVKLNKRKSAVSLLFKLQREI